MPQTREKYVRVGKVEVYGPEKSVLLKIVVLIYLDARKIFEVEIDNLNNTHRVHDHLRLVSDLKTEYSD